MPWTLAAFLALGCFTAAFLAIARLGQRLDNLPLVAGLLAVQAVLALGHLLASGTRPWPGPAALPLLLGASALCYLGNLAQTHAIARAPNPGLALAIIGASTALVTVLAALLAGTPLGAGRLAGVGLCLAGVTVVGLAR